VVDDSGGVDRGDCPTNSYDCGVPSSDSEKMARARACFKIYNLPVRDGGGLQSQYDFAVACAKNALSECAAAQQESDCHQAVKLKVEAYNGSESKTSDYLYFWLPGSSSGETTTYSSYSGLPSLDSGKPANYRLHWVHLPGYQVLENPLNPTTIQSDTVYLTFNTDTGALSFDVLCRVNCGSLADLDGVGGSSPTQEDISIMEALVGNRAPNPRIAGSFDILGRPLYSTWPPLCADVDDDGVMTENDLQCLDAWDTPAKATACVGCESAIGNSYYAYEICNDGYDNNCDGQKDVETYDNILNSVIGSIPAGVENLCSCTANTPCEMIRQQSEGNPTTYSEGDISRCLSLSDLHSGEYRWYGPNQWECNSLRAANAATLRCNGNQFTCVEEGGTYIWKEFAVNPRTFPLEDPPFLDCYYDWGNGWRFLGYHNQMGNWTNETQNWKDNSFICYDGGIYSCGWEVRADQRPSQIQTAANNQVIGSWRCACETSSNNNCKVLTRQERRSGNWVPA
jgi:hypothetical protein